MPPKLKKGGPSRLYLEGLYGQKVDGKVVRMIKPHGAARRTRTVTFRDGSTKNYSIEFLLDILIKLKENGDV